MGRPCRSEGCVTQLTENVKVRLDRATKRRLEREAKRVERPVGSVIRIAIREHLERKETA